MKEKGQVPAQFLSGERGFVRQELVLKVARKRARDCIRNMQTDFPKKSLIQLLPVQTERPAPSAPNPASPATPAGVFPQLPPGGPAPSASP